MRKTESWIWLPKEKYPENQTTYWTPFNKNADGNYTVAEFKRVYEFNKKITSVKLRLSADTQYQLYCNEKILATGPVLVGGDFYANERLRPNFYASEMEIYPESEKLDFFARVKMMPVSISEYSKGHGGFMLTGHVTFEDGTKELIMSDTTWQVRKNGAYVKPDCYDSRIKPDEYVYAAKTDNIWNTITAPILLREEKEVFPIKGSEISIEANDERKVILEFDKIYSGFIWLQSKSDGVLFADIHCQEIDEQGPHESVVLENNGVYRSLSLYSVGRYEITIKNTSDKKAVLNVGLIDTYYPVRQCAETKTSDERLNKILDVCAHTLKHCRQLHHMDSPRHCEPLACTGDYYIESLMTIFSYADMSLAEFDVVRTAELLRNNDGRMFHTTYSLIWVMMLHDVYMATGNKKLLEDCEDALYLLLSRFETYIGENHLIENPPDYMFVDWIFIDDISMHHPPKALGQTCLNMFYYKALEDASKIYEELSEKAMAQKCTINKEVLKKAINELLYDKDKGMYFEGLNTPSPEHTIYQYLPQNTEKRYYLKHSNILAAYTGVCERKTAKSLIHKIMDDEIKGDYQPYFAHYLLEAIYRNGLCSEYTLKVIERWKKPVEECQKGLVEGFLPPEPGYNFDHSHAWGGTPLYSLPKALLGFEILEPGMKKIKLSPSLLGIKKAMVELITPYGMLIVNQEEGKQPQITCPKEIVIVE